jgi:hypothetical protein
MSLTGRRVCAHRWANQSGQPLACTTCGALWPGDPEFPPEYVAKVVGYGEVKNGHVPWARRVDAMVHDLREIE